MSRKRSKGLVQLVGAGPGDPELLTLKALRALKAADAVLYDDLVAAPVLDLVRRGAMRLYVGKRAGRHSLAQAEINALLIRIARSGRRVVRLKAGDPCIFGRAGEEIAALTGAGIGVEIIPGITTASALAAQLKVSLTRRACASGVRFITAHGANGGLPEDLDWQGLADPKTTLVVYMGGRTGAALAAGLIAAGRDGMTPCVIARDVSRPGFAGVKSCLSALAAGQARVDGEGPIVIAIGDAFAQAEFSAGRSAPALIEDLAVN